MCGVVGMVSGSAVNQQLYDALTVLQHRGQDAAGIVTCDCGNSISAQRQRSRQRRIPAAAHAAAGRQHGNRSRTLSHGRQFELGRSAADVRELSVWHHARAQRQSDELRTAEARRVSRRPATREHGIGFRGVAERVCARVATHGRTPPGTRPHLRGDRRRASAMPWRVSRWSRW